MYGLLALKGVLMIVSFLVSIKELVAKGRDFPWPRPKVCPRCDGNRVWGHGFVTAFFDGFADQVLLRRYRCPDCRCVIRMRPSGFFKRFQASIDAICSSIAYRLEKGRWPPGSSRTRQGHWLRSLYRKTFAHRGQESKSRLLQGFDFLVRMDEIPVSRCI